ERSPRTPASAGTDSPTCSALSFGTAPRSLACIATVPPSASRLTRGSDPPLMEWIMPEGITVSIPRNGPKAAAAARAMVATSQSAATDAGLRILEQGGNAVDAALAAATVLSVTEPMSTGVGGDLFALICSDGNVVALDAAGPAPAGAPAQQPTQDSGPESITVPGAVGGWA